MARTTSATWTVSSTALGRSWDRTYLLRAIRDRVGIIVLYIFTECSGGTAALRIQRMRGAVLFWRDAPQILLSTLSFLAGRSDYRIHRQTDRRPDDILAGASS